MTTTTTTTQPVSDIMIGTAVCVKPKDSVFHAHEFYKWDRTDKTADGKPYRVFYTPKEFEKMTAAEFSYHFKMVPGL